MKRWLSMMLLIGALVGAFAQEAAFASVPVVQSAQQTNAVEAMDAACMEAMGQSEHSSDDPCKGLTLDCIRKMGCALPLAQAQLGQRIANPFLPNAIVLQWTSNLWLIAIAGLEPASPPSILG